MAHGYNLLKIIKGAAATDRAQAAASPAPSLKTRHVNYVAEAVGLSPKVVEDAFCKLPFQLLSLVGQLETVKSRDPAVMFAIRNCIEAGNPSLAVISSAFLTEPYSFARVQAVEKVAKTLKLRFDLVEGVFRDHDSALTEVRLGLSVLGPMSEKLFLVGELIRQRNPGAAAKALSDEVEEGMQLQAAGLLGGLDQSGFEELAAIARVRSPQKPPDLDTFVG